MSAGCVQNEAGAVHIPLRKQPDHAIRVRDSVSAIPVLLDAYHGLRFDGRLGE